MTYPGLGGQQPPPQNASPAGQLVPGVTPGVSGQVVASRVIIIGSGGELLVYSPSAGAGNLIASIAGMATTDIYGNNVLQGVASYGASFAAALLGGLVELYTGSEAGGWTAVADMVAAAGGNLLLSSANAIVTNNNTLDNGSGAMIVATTLTVNGSTHTTINGVSSPGTVGTSGPASAGTAHTHSAGSYQLGSGAHQHSSFGG